MNAKPLVVVCLGGFGHTYAVLDDLRTIRSAVDLLGVFPAYEGEEIGEGFLAHPVLEGLNVGAFHEFPDAPYENAVAIVSTRLDLLAEASARAARKGWHLIVEKPLATNESDLTELHSTVLTQRRRIMTMLTMRGFPAFRQVRDIVRSGQLGRLSLLNLRKSYKWGTRPSWFGEADKYPGTIPWIGIHTFDMMSFISGERIAEVSAFAANTAHHSHPACEDAASLILRGSAGLQGSASIDLLRPSVAGSHGDDWVRVVGEHGVVEGGPAPRHLQIIAPQATAELTVGSEPHPIFREFIETLAGPRDADEDIGFHLTETCLAANRSIAASSVQRIDPDRWRFV